VQKPPREIYILSQGRERSATTDSGIGGRLWEEQELSPYKSGRPGCVLQWASTKRTLVQFQLWGKIGPGSEVNNMGARKLRLNVSAFSGTSKG